MFRFVDATHKNHFRFKVEQLFVCSFESGDSLRIHGISLDWHSGSSRPRTLITPLYLTADGSISAEATGREGDDFRWAPSYLMKRDSDIGIYL